jgi:hypothetical protein
LSSAKSSSIIRPIAVNVRIGFAAVDGFEDLEIGVDRMKRGFPFEDVFAEEIERCSHARGVEGFDRIDGGLDRFARYEALGEEEEVLLECRVGSEKTIE